MAHYNRAVIAVLLAGAGIASTAVPAAAADLQEQKWEAVQQALAQTSPAFQREARAALDNAAALESITLPAAGNMLTLRLSADSVLKLTTLDGGSSLAIDLANTVCLEAMQSNVDDPAGLIARVRSSVYSVKPAFVARVVLDLKTPCTATEISTPAGTQVELVAKNDRSKRTSVHFAVEKTDEFSIEKESDVDLLVAQLSNVAGRTLTGPTLPTESAAEMTATTSEESQLFNTLMNLRSNNASAVAQDPVSELLTQQLRAVASAKVEIKASDVVLNAAQDSKAGSFDTVGGDSDSGVESSGEIFPAPAAPAAPAPAAPAPAAPAAPAAGDTETLEGGASTPEGVEPPMPRGPVEAGAVESNTAIVSKMKELIEAAVPNGPVKAVAPSGETAGSDAPKAEETLAKATTGDPLTQRVNIDFREMELVNVVAILANKAGINIIAGTDLQGTVTANLQNVTLRQAMDTVLRQNGLGLMEEEGIYRIVTYEEAQEAQRATQLVELENAKADEVASAITASIKGLTLQRLVNVTSNEGANIVIISGPANRIGDLVDLARQLDVAEPVLPTITEPIKLNYAAPEDVAVIVKGMLTEQVGSVSSDERGRFVIVKDVPVVVEQVRSLVEEIDRPMKQVVIDTMVVDVALEDNADTGVNWLLSAVQDQSRRQAAQGADAPNIGNLQELALGTNMEFSQNPASSLAFGVLSGDINWSGVISAEIRNQNGRMVSNPVLVAIENTQAKISISQEIPYVELRQTSGGGSQTTTEFKEVGTILQVTPTVTHDDHILVEIQGKESSTAGEFNGVPIEDKREVTTNLRMANGQTIFIGGLRKNDNNATVRKVPVLGNIPVVNFLFRSNQRTEQVNELIIFMTCSVLDEDKTGLTAYQRAKLEGGKSEEVKVDVENNMYHDMIYPQEMRDPLWKWRRP